MMREKFGYFVVEGHHDIAAVARVLEMLGFQEKDEIGNIDAYWKGILGSITFPRKTKKGKEKIHMRLPVPYIFETDSVSIAIQPAENVAEVVEVLHSTLFDSREEMQQSKMVAIAVFCDADPKDDKDVHTVFGELLAEIQAKNRKEHVPMLDGFATLQRPGEVSAGCPRTGIFIFPDNQNMGTLEAILIKCGRIVYNGLFQQAERFVDSVEERFKKKTWNESARGKATIGVVGNVLNPSASNVVTIRKDEWIGVQTKELAPVAQLVRFVEQLLAEKSFP